MNIDKAIIKQKKSLKRFMFSSGFIFLVILSMLIFLPKLFVALKIILIILEMIILIIISNKVEDKYLNYKVYDDKICIKKSILEYVTILRNNKVLLVHTKNNNKDMKIIVLVSSKVKRRNFKEVNGRFLTHYKEIHNEFENIKNKHPGQKYFYTTIDNGAFIKFRLLNDIYMKSDNAFFSDAAVETIKQYRNVE